MEDKTLSIVHIDTNFLAYGKMGEPSKEKMGPWFETLGWTEESVLDQIEQQLIANQQSDYKMAVGHHPVGHTCRPTYKVGKVEDLMR